jgi:hypothetical protein
MKERSWPGERRADEEGGIGIRRRFIFNKDEKDGVGESGFRNRREESGLIILILRLAGNTKRHDS